jgi:hypothetical protein
MFFKKHLPVIVLLVAFALRAWQLTAVPPGLTHDEAGHGHDAAHVLKGITPIYFTVGYGREPLFDYLNAGLMAGMGASAFTLRFAAACWGMIALAATYRAARLAFDRRTALLALLLMAVSFWPLATSRQALRSAMLPGEIALAVALFLQLQKLAAEHTHAKRAKRRKWLLVIELGLVLAASLYTYIPARALWLMFPLAALINAVQTWNREARFAKDVKQTLLSRSTFACLSRPAPDVLRFMHYALRNTQYVLLSLLIAFALAAPLFLYLSQHPDAEQRIGMLSEPLAALRNGDASPLLANARETLLALFLPGHGDHFLAYTIPGKPLFDPITFVLFLIGLLILVYHLVTRSPLHLVTPTPPHPNTSPLLTLWLLLGLAPPLITGPEAFTTRLVGAQPLLYILPALALSRIMKAISRWQAAASRGKWPLRLADGKLPFVVRLSSPGLVSLFVVSLFISSFRDYFFTWGQSPDVRAAYQSTLITMLRTLDGPTVISTVYPSAPHDPYIAELITSQRTRWVDGRLALLIPANPEFQLLVPASTPLHLSFSRLVQPHQIIALRSTDLDPSFTLYTFTQPDFAITNLINFNDAIQLINSHWSADSYRPGDVAELTTVWSVTNPARLGSLHPPAFKTDLNLFTHVLNPDGTIFLQRDSLDAPSWDWQADDTIIQIHQLAIPADAAPGEYATEVGLYDRITGDRLLVIDSGADSAQAPPLIIR